MLSPNEIEKIEEIGTLDGSPVKMILTKGGFFVAAGKPRGKNTDEALAAGSHGAIVRFNVEKQYAGRFQPALRKSEGEAAPVVHDHTQLLSKENSLKGFRLYTVNHTDRVEAVITKNGNQVMIQEALAKGEELEIQTDIGITDVKNAKELSSVAMSLARAFAEEATVLKKEYVQVQTQAKRIKASDLKKG